ncbi:DNA replication/repair protein RecF [Alteraurantiacibacter buctensis]|uniref:DNA replication and repair protein RecF n=1 Tax=Alteraurantiacibacter buctensis TaxID=1503981 RepID=A0A844Z318_9SPHN|nr:DNA replication/repair protein RecF [Alteraurantiacibacter buctensis]MXO72917.1 DNA replication/repair protein RecF [Alteraurantiacibacter buctensis]
MALDRITLAHFRNHAATRLDGARAFNLLVGENGAGKTNVLEALSLLAPGRGLRRAALAEMAGQGAAAAADGGFAVSAALATGDGEAGMLGTAMQGDRPTRRLVQVNGAEASAVSLGEWLALGWLTPAMDRLFMDSASARRRYLDRLAVALDPGHARHATRYEGALRERNRLLAGDMEPDPAWLSSIEAQMAASGASLAAGRARLVDTLAAELAKLPDEPFARPLLRLVPGGAVDESQLIRDLAAQRPRDRAAGRTLNGPHRDELEVAMHGKGGAEGMPAALCSTGEQKAMLIALTLAHATLAAKGRPGVLLLDEVAAHLDPLRRAAMFERLRETGAQVWLTGTEMAPFSDIAGEAAVWRVAAGAVERVG